jgi:hypothetical protein
MLRYFWNWLLSFFSSWRNSREVKQEEANLDTKIEEAKVVRDKLIEQQAEREVAIKEVSGAADKVKADEVAADQAKVKADAAIAEVDQVKPLDHNVTSDELEAKLRAIK